MIDQDRKRARERRGSKQYREKNRAQDIPATAQIDRAIALVVLTDSLRPGGAASDKRLLAELEQTIAKKICGSNSTSPEQEYNLVKTVRRRIKYLLEDRSIDHRLANLDRFLSDRHEK